MITISLDEQGRFEGDLTEYSKPTFVAGVIFDDESIEGESDRERERICQYYRHAIDKAGEGDNCYVFPKSLHVGNDERSSNGTIVGNVKHMVKKTIGEFIKEGTFDGKELLPSPRRGKYFFYANVISDTGISNYLGENKSILTKDDYASNRYFHMTSGILERLIFHNPVIPNIKEVSLNIATRRTEDYAPGSIEENQYSALGYKNNSNDSRKRYYQVGGVDIYRTALAQEMIKSQKLSLKIVSFEIKPILYHYYNIEDQKNMAFLYLADTICAIAKDVASKNPDVRLDALSQVFDLYNFKERNLIFAYDDVDMCYQRAWNAYEEGDYYNALAICYVGENHKSAFAPFYNMNWFTKIKEYIENSNNISYLDKAVRALENSILSNKYDSDLAQYIFRSVEKNALRLKDLLIYNEQASIFCKLYSAAISVYCHLGDSNNALMFFEKLKEYISYADISSYLNVLNKLIVAETDSFNSEKAMEYALEGVEIQELVKDLKDSIKVFSGSGSVLSVDKGKSHSSLGQVYAFMRDNKAEKEFRKALKCMPEGSPNYKITQFYLMQYYLDRGDKESYEKEAASYFDGATTLSNQFKYIMKHAFSQFPLINYRFSLYLFLKALYSFYINDMSPELYDKIAHLNDTIKREEKREIKKADERVFSEIKGHPAELIYKYISFIEYSKGDVELSKETIQKSRSCIINPGTTIKIIMCFSDIEYARVIGSEDDVQKGIIRMRNIFKSAKQDKLESLLIMNDNDFYENLNEMITYMYR